MGIKNKLHIMSINPNIKAALDEYFDERYPPKPVIDRRRRAAKTDEEEVHEYDRFYDVPKSEFSHERALEIEKESWDTTKILTEAFSDENEIKNEDAPLNAPALIIEPIASPTQTNSLSKEVENFTKQFGQASGGLLDKIKAEIGDIADFIGLCRSPSPTAQRAFASSKGLSLDEIADRINETAADVFGDILLEDVGGAYKVLEDYIDQL
jgi:hypothetical protein